MSKTEEKRYLNPPKGGWGNAQPPIKFETAKHDGTADGPKRETRYGKRHVPGQMNGVETEYAEELELRKIAGEIDAWFFEAVTFVLAKGSRYTPDFLIHHIDAPDEYVNVKGAGPIDPNSLTKMKAAADKFPRYLFSMVQKLKKKDAAEHGGMWKRREF